MTSDDPQQSASGDSAGGGGGGDRRARLHRCGRGHWLAAVIAFIAGFLAAPIIALLRALAADWRRDRALHEAGRAEAEREAAKDALETRSRADEAARASAAVRRTC